MTAESELRGRTVECAQLDRLLASARAGASGALVVRGEAGAGKSALLEYVRGRASGCAIVRAAGVESEMELAFAGLHQVCAPFLNLLDRLPSPQADALRTAFGLHAGPPPDPFLVGLATLSLLSDVAEGRPLVCLIDDVQWLDRASAQVLGFVARRLADESVLVVFAVREPGDDPRLADLPSLALGPLPDPDARAILASAMTGTLDEAVRDRIVAEARGNPLALLELPRSWMPAALAGGFGFPDSVPISGRIEEIFRRRMKPLPDDSKQLLLVVAAEPVGDPTLIASTAERLGIPMAAAEPATVAGLLDLGTHVRFRHPLVRSVVYRSAAGPDRRRVHSALAAATDPERDPDRRAWHLGAAADGPDEAVAAELERSAGRAQARGGLAAAAAFLRRAVELTPDTAQRGARAVAAAQISLQAGEFAEALELLDTAESGSLGDFHGALVDLLRGHIAFASGFGSDAPRMLLKAARRLEPFDLGTARETYLTAWAAASLAGPAGGDVLLEVCRAARAVPTPEARSLDILLDGVALVITDGHAAAVPTLWRAVVAVADIPIEDVLRWGWMATVASALVWDFDAMHAIAERMVRLVRSAGALAHLPTYLAQVGITTTWMGDFEGAASVVAESDSVAAATGSRIGPYTLLRLRALQGQEAEASATIAKATELAAETGQGMATAWASWAAATLENGLGRYAEAAAAAQKAMSDSRDPSMIMWSLPELVEAAARSGQVPLATDALARLSETTRPVGTDSPLGIEARSRALLTQGDGAEDLYREAIDRLGRTRLRPDFARAHLVYGEWLRRRGRRVDARVQLRAAHDLFELIGMEAFGERARRELVATGETVRKRSVETLDQLTPQELQIARLAGDGRTNQEIGAELFLSPRTVEWHLRKVFAKLGVVSRKELRAALPPTRAAVGV